MQKSAFRLTFRTMQGNAYLRSRSRRTAVSALSAVLVLAFAAFPVFAQADSAGAQYQDRLPTATGPNKKDHNNNGGSDNQSSGGGGNSSQGGAAGGSGGSSPPSGPSSAPSGSSGSGNGASTGSSGAPTQGNGPETVNASNAGYKSDSGGGSSPLAGILVGLGLGAVVSVIFVVMRARRQRGDSEAVQTPHAG